jgi:hypothetical protein
MFGPSLGLLALVLLAALAAAAVLLTLLAALRRAPAPAREPGADALQLAGVGLAGVAGATIALALGGPGAIAWWWPVAVLAALARAGEARLPALPGMSGGAGPFGHVLAVLSGAAGLVAALAAGALLHAQQGAEVLQDAVGLRPLVAGPLLAGLLALTIPLTRRRAGAALAALALAGFAALALAAVLADPAATSSGLSDMSRAAWSADAAAGGLLAGLAQAVLWASLAGGPGLAAPATRPLTAAAAPLLAAAVATASALLIAAAPPAPLTDPTPAPLEQHLGVGLQPSEYGQTVVLAPGTALQDGMKYEVVLRASPRGHRLGDLLPGDNIVALHNFAIAEHIDAIILRDKHPARRDNPGFDVRIPVVREVVETNLGKFVKLRPTDRTVDILRLMKARDLDGPYLPLGDYHFLGSVRRALGDRLLLSEDPRPKGSPSNPPLRDLIAMGYAGPYLDPGGATPAPPVALAGAPALAAAPGDLLHLRLDAPERGLELGFVNRLGELEVPPWDFLAASSVAVLRHAEDPALDLRIPVVSRVTMGRLRFVAADPVIEFDKLPEGYTGPHLVPAPVRFAAEVRSGARLPAELRERLAVIPLHDPRRTSGNAIYSPHPADALLAGMRPPVRDQFGAAAVLPGLVIRLGRPAAIAGGLLLALLAALGLASWLRSAQRRAEQAFGGGAPAVLLLFFAAVLAAPAVAPEAIVRAALPAVAVAAVLGLTASVVRAVRFRP